MALRYDDYDTYDDTAYNDYHWGDSASPAGSGAGLASDGNFTGNQETMDEYDAVVNTNYHHKVSNRFFGPGTDERSEFTAYRNDTSGCTTLIDYPVAFVTAQEYSFCNYDETYVEQAHSTIANLLSVASGFVTPAVVAALLRHVDFKKLLQNQHFIDFIHSRWQI